MGSATWKTTADVLATNLQIDQAGLSMSATCSTTRRLCVFVRTVAQRFRVPLDAKDRAHSRGFPCEQCRHPTGERHAKEHLVCQQLPGLLDQGGRAGRRCRRTRGDSHHRNGCRGPLAGRLLPNGEADLSGCEQRCRRLPRFAQVCDDTTQGMVLSAGAAGPT